MNCNPVSFISVLTPESPASSPYLNNIFRHHHSTGSNGSNGSNDFQSLKNLSLNELLTTDMELMTMAMAPKTGSILMPKKG